MLFGEISAALIAVTWVLTAGCHRCDTTWSTQAQSPDGKVMATASTLACSGFGTGAIHTAVSLNWTGDQRPATEVVGFSDETEVPDKTMVQIKWITPTHLEASYRAERHVTFQAIKWADIEISLVEMH